MVRSSCIQKMNRHIYQTVVISGTGHSVLIAPGSSATNGHIRELTLLDKKLLDKLQKVLALTGSCVETEAQAAAGCLARLLVLHNLDIADLERRGAVEVPKVSESKHNLGKAAFKWKLKLAEEIAEHYFCYALIDHKIKHVSFVGRPDNVDSLRMLYDWLINQVRDIASVERCRYIAENNEHIDPLRWQVGFGEGAAIRFGERLREQRQRESTEAGTALVISHTTEISDFLETQYGYRTDGRSTKMQQEYEERWNARKERLDELRRTDPEAYFRECPWNRPLSTEEEVKQGKERARLAKREEYNAKRRKGYQWKDETSEEWAKRQQRQIAESSGYQAADRVNLTPFLTGEVIGERPTLPTEPILIGE